MKVVKRIPYAIGAAFAWLFVWVFGDRFKMAYWVIAGATAQHTAWGAAITMQGLSDEGKWWWWAQGLAFAIGIDFLMVMVASKIRSGVPPQRLFGKLPFNWYIVTFVMVALFSTYFQLLYAWKHISDLNPGNGVTPDWKANLEGLINARIIIAPLALPLVATLYTLGGLGKGGEKASRPASNGNSIGKRLDVSVPALPSKSTIGHTKAPDASDKARVYLQRPGAMEENPVHIAKKLGISKSTVYSVRNKLLNGQDNGEIRQ